MYNVLSDKSEKIVQRWFEAFDHLTRTDQIYSVRAFAADLGISRTALVRLRTEPTRKFELELLAVLVRDYGVKAHWLITGNGPRGF